MWLEWASIGSHFMGEEEGGDECLRQLQEAIVMARRAGPVDVVAHEGLEAGRSLAAWLVDGGSFGAVQG
jgi:hypothetical protein